VRSSTASPARCATARRAAWVAAVVVSVRRRNGGYAVELGENDASHTKAGAGLEAYLPERNLAAIRQKLGLNDFDPADLEKSSVIARVALNFDPRFHLRGTIQDINPAIGASLLAKHLERIRARLRADGLLHAQSHLPTPSDIRRLAVIHPSGAAAWADVATELGRLQQANVLEVFDMDATFEGPSAVASIMAALRKVRELPLLDAVMLVRGGGASSGLEALASEDLARAICASPVPIITGIGHASDRGLLDEVAWRAADTPSKALRLVLDLIAQPAASARKNWSAVVGHCTGAVDRQRQSLDSLLNSVATNSLTRFSASDAQLEQALAGLRICVATWRANLGHQAENLERLRAELLAGAPKALALQTDQSDRIIGDGARSARAEWESLFAGLPPPTEIGGAVAALMEAQENALAVLGESFFAHIARRLDAEAASSGDLERTLRSLSVQDTLERGFSLAVSTHDGALITTAAEARAQKTLHVHFVDGIVAVRPESSSDSPR
jgi:exodeoxyribonuclease VII large subunit